MSGEFQFQRNPGLIRNGGCADGHPEIHQRVIPGGLLGVADTVANSLNEFILDDTGLQILQEGLLVRDIEKAAAHNSVYFRAEPLALLTGYFRSFSSSFSLMASEMSIPVLSAKRMA